MINDFIDKVICGNTLDILKKIPDNSVDLGITSPPYNKKEDNKGWLVDKVVYKGTSDNLPEKEYQQNQIEVLNELYRIIKPGGSFFYNHKIRWEKGVMYHPMDWLRKTKWVIKQEIIWDRMIAANLRGWRFWQIEERIYWLYKPDGKNLIGKELKSKHALLTSIWRLPPENKNPHPAPFPIELPTRIIYSIFDEEKGKIVIDPYCGSGTTLVAAKILGHHYIGIDISQEYINFAIERLKNYQAEIPKVQEELSKHFVKKTFKERKEKGEFVGKYRKNRNGQPLLEIIENSKKD
ncbi:site-specific DNA-methyltransferase [Persephonella sp.]|uniref:DNA-methyltransferase n=1 Tax=Persephonella sp. TaxID=2060922 RepID=UPI00262C5FA3|nr:site-specific DNA-methyltransferase [Persephonella sp.]